MSSGIREGTLAAVSLVLTLGGPPSPGGGGELPEVFAVGAQEPEPTEQTPFRTFALYVLSRGKGVPDEARKVFGEVRDLAESDQEEGIAVTIQTKRFGLEGERRLCVEYQEEEKARRLFGRAKALVEGVDLARVVVETCIEPREDEDEKKGEEP